MKQGCQIENEKKGYLLTLNKIAKKLTKVPSKLSSSLVLEEKSDNRNMTVSDISMTHRNLKDKQ